MRQAPEACSSVIEHCPRLAPNFYRPGTPPPCDPSTSAKPPRTDEDIYGFDGCRPTPARFVILGDSIAACPLVGPADCGPLLIGEYLRDIASSDLVVESHAVSGAVIADLPEQAALVEGGMGHVVVWIHILGNDLAARQVDQDAWHAAWTSTFDHFGDAMRFPEGATFLLNTQYSPYDQCPSPLGYPHGVSISIEAEQRLQEVNRREFLDRAEARSDTVAIDQYPDWLGHGRFADVLGCPHCGADNTSWMAFDGIHPNALGYEHMAAKWRVALDRMFGTGCTGR